MPELFANNSQLTFEVDFGKNKFDAFQHGFLLKRGTGTSNELVERGNE